MGSYDTVHGGWRCGQTKALGKNLRQVLPGDGVSLIPAPRNDEELRAWMENRAVVRPESSFALEMVEDGYLLVRDGEYIEWTAHLPAGLPLFDTLGQELAEPTPQLLGSAPSDEADACPACQAVRTGQLLAYREQLAVQRELRRAEVAQRRADRARSAFRAV